MMRSLGRMIKMGLCKLGYILLTFLFLFEIYDFGCSFV